VNCILERGVLPSMWTIRKAVPGDLAAVLRLFDEAVAWLNSWGNTVQWGSALKLG